MSRERYPLTFIKNIDVGRLYISDLELEILQEFNLRVDCKNNTIRSTLDFVNELIGEVYIGNCGDLESIFEKVLPYLKLTENVVTIASKNENLGFTSLKLTSAIYHIEDLNNCHQRYLEFQSRTGTNWNRFTDKFIEIDIPSDNPQSYVKLIDKDTKRVVRITKKPLDIVDKLNLYNIEKIYVLESKDKDVFYFLATKENKGLFYQVFDTDTCFIWQREAIKLGIEVDSPIREPRSNIEDLGNLQNKIKDLCYEHDSFFR